MTIQQCVKEEALLIEKDLAGCFSDTLTGKNILTEAMQYSLLGGGKRIRAFLVIECCRAFGGDREMAVPFACAMEMVHAYSLIHDDLPCMDNDDFRRGKPTNHKVYGEMNALLAGDTLLTYAFQVLASNRKVSPLSVVLASRTLAECAGPLGMAGGQFFDTNQTVRSLDDLYRMYAMKTGALLRASCLLGYYAATDCPDSQIEEALVSFAEHLGVAFQVTDDILDVTSTTEQLGKPVGSDAKNNKGTILAYKTLEEAKAYAKELTDCALSALQTIPNHQTLFALTEMLLNRNQ